MLYLNYNYFSEFVMQNRIKDLRENHDLTQSDISKILHISQVAYSYYEIGKRSIPIETLIKLADFYDVSIDYILNRTNIKEINSKNTSRQNRQNII